MHPETHYSLYRYTFTDQEKPLLESNNFRVSAFRYGSGVEAVRVKNNLGEIIVLPFQGQQVWRAQFNGRELTMKSMFSEPQPTHIFEANYGAFVIHCGATAMGDPAPQDKHPLHGELPNAAYHEAFLTIGEDAHGAYVGVNGKYQHTLAFAFNYLAEPSVKLHENSSLLTISMNITNLKRSPMELMYLAHINFRPVNGGRLVYSALPNPQHVRVRPYAPGLAVPPGYEEFISELAGHPEKHHEMTAQSLFDPEAVFFIDYLTDEEGWAHTLQVLPDGSADYVRYRPTELPKGLRWISRTPDQDALGMALPATAESEGYLKEKEKGNLKILRPNERFTCEFEAGALDAAAAQTVQRKIASIVDGAQV